MLESTPVGNAGDHPPHRQNEQSPILRRAGLYLGVAFELPGTIIGGLLAGYFLDQYLGTSPWLLIVLTAIAFAEALRPDVALIDVELPLMDGIAVAERLRALRPRPAVIMLTLRDDADTRERACAAGVSAFVAKRGIPDELIAAIRQAVRPPAAAPPMDRTEL